MYARDYSTKGMPLIKLKEIGAVNATRENFNISVKRMTPDKAFRQNINAETGVYCLVPDELEIPF